MPRRAPSTSPVRGGRQRPPSHRLQSAEASPLAGPAAAAPVTPVRPASTAADLAEAAFQPISRVKVIPTPHREATLSRERLLDWLRDHARQRLSLVIAEAGYGKTTLLADFSRRGEIRCLWYKLDSTDGDWVTFLNYLIASGREAVPEFARATTALLGQMAVRNPPRELVIATFMAELGQLGDEPTVWIFDDFHVVDESEDVREIVTRLLRDAPESVQICLVTRRRPDLVLGRLAAQGQLAELDTPAMRFSLEETGHLFEDVYGQPLEPDVLRQVEERTQGWAASLQLLNSSIRGRSRTEVRAFVRVMSGAEGPLYDFLAEEVMNELPPDLKRFLLHASLLERITEDYVAAAMERNGERPTPDAVRAWIAGATDLGLLGRVDPVGRTRQLHPLLRDFLRHEVASLFIDEEVASIEARAGRAAPPEDWLFACRHLMRAGLHEEAADVLDNAVLQALGTGQWGSASGILSALRTPLRTSSRVLLAREQVSNGRPSAALGLLADVDLSDLAPQLRAAARHVRAYAAWWRGDAATFHDAIDGARHDSATPLVYRRIADTWFLLMRGDAGLSYRSASEHLSRLADEQRDDGLHYYAGISFYNAMLFEIGLANYEVADRLGHLARDQFDLTGASPPETRSVLASLATSSLEQGRLEEALELVGQATAPGLKDLDALTESSAVMAMIGHYPKAHELLSTAAYEASQRTPGAVNSWSFAQTHVRVALTEGQYAEAARRLADHARPDLIDFDGAGLAHLTRALVAFGLQDFTGAKRVAEEGYAVALRQGAARWLPRLDLVASAASDDGVRFAAALAALPGTGELALLQLAEVVTSSLHLMSEVPDSVRRSIGRYPRRWLPVFRRRIVSGHGAESIPAAKLLEEFGTAHDVPLLRAVDHKYGRSRRMGLGKSLARRISPRLRVHDLGIMSIEVGDRRSEIATLRRRSAALLLYLSSHRSSSMHREQALEDLWPEASLTSATNNLNQTLYFLRRDIDPWYDEGTSVDYIRFEGDVLRLDDEMVWTASSAFDKDVSALRVGSGWTAVDHALAAFSTYQGRFAPGFEYDEWSVAWRNHLHARYLQLAEWLIVSFASGGDLASAQEVALAALRCDAQALELERHLIWIYGASGSMAAASELYRHYSGATRTELAVEPPSLSDVLELAPGTHRR